MALIKNLKLKLKSGLLSELQSDTIFGHFAWRFKDKHGDNKLIEFLEKFTEGKPVFSISDGILGNDKNIFFPKPLKLTPAKFDKKLKKERIQNFLKQKESKSRKYITLDELNLYLLGKYDEFDELIIQNSNQTFPKYEQDLRISVEMDRATMKSKESRLFSYNPKFLPENVVINIFIKIFDYEFWQKYNCDEILESIFEIGYGKKKSSGYGQFEITEKLKDFQNFAEPENTNGFISLSHYLPANNDGIKESFYEINVKYGKLGEEYSKSQNPFKPALLMLKPGSCFLTDIKKEFYGRAANNLIDYKPNVLQNGIAFSLNCKFI